MGRKTRTPFGERMLAARKAAGLTQEAVAKQTGIGQSTIAGIESEFHSSTLTPVLAALYNADPLYLATGAASMREAVAQSVSHPQTMIVPTTKEWGDLMGDLPSTFALELRDEAMADALPAGTKVIFSTRETPRPPDIVLVCDAAGHFYVREYRERTPGHWQAVAYRNGYEPLDSRADGLRVVAVYIGQLGRRG